MGGGLHILYVCLAPSWCSPFCTEALQPTGVGITNFGTVGKRLQRRILAEVFGYEPKLATGFLRGWQS
jgi:hypothetical protein